MNATTLFGDTFTLRAKAQKKKVKKIEVIQLLNENDWEYLMLKDGGVVRNFLF